MGYKLITEKELDEIWKPSENLQPTKKAKAIDEAQELQLYKILGGAFYDEIIQQAETNTVTVANQLIIGKSRKIIAYWAEFYALDSVFANAYNKGFNTPSSEYGAVTDVAVVKDHKRIANQKADEYTIRLIEFICANKNDYPLYDSKEEPTENLRMAGFVFPKKGAENREKNTILNKLKDNI